MRMTFGQVKATLAKSLNLPATDSRVKNYCDRAQERLLYNGKYKDTLVRYAVCVNEACLTWPRDIETIEQVAVCSQPYEVRNQWYEFIDAGWGILDEDSGAPLTLVDRGSRVAFDDVIGTGKKIAVYSDGTENSTAKILLRYYNSTGNKVYTTASGSREEGEYITLPAAGAYAYTTYEVMPYGLYGVIKPATNRVVRLYQYTVVGGALKPLAYYEPDEEIPEYRASLIPCLKNGGCGAGCDGGTCDKSTVTVIGKARARPIYNDNTQLIIAHQDAIRLACQAIKKEEDNFIVEAEVYWNKAFECLDRQLHHYMGDGAIAPIRIESPSGSVLNLI